MKFPITRAIKYESQNKPFVISFSSDNMWTIKDVGDLTIKTQLPNIRIFESIPSFEFFQTIINILIFNKLDTNRMIILEGTELLYFLESDEEISIPLLPNYDNVSVIFTLTKNLYNSESMWPTLRITKNENVISKKRKLQTQNGR